MDQDIINKTVVDLETADTHGVLSIQNDSNFVVVDFDTEKAKGMGKFISLPEHAFFGLFQVGGMPETSSRTIRVPWETEEYRGKPAALGMVGGIITSKNRYLFLDYNLRSSANSKKVNISQSELKNEEPIRPRFEGTRPTMRESVWMDRQEITILSDSESLIEATELRYLIRLAQSCSFKSKLNTKNTEAITVIEYAATEFLRQSVGSLPSPRETKHIINNACDKLKVNKNRLARYCKNIKVEPVRT